jgi:glycosyltransferase involved in cell wall biosynthesis
MVTAPLVSVVIPSFQQEEFIDDAVRSVLGQSDVDFELIVADHSSTDGTWDRLQPYAADPRVTLVRTPPGGGAPANWAAVSAMARGTFLKLLPGDDVILPGTLARQAALLLADASLVLTAGRRDIVDAHGKPIVRGRGLGPLRRRAPGSEVIRAVVRSGTNLLGEPGAVLMRRDAFEVAGSWDPSSPYAIDIATYLRVLERGDFVPDLATASTFRISGGQWSVALVRTQAAEVANMHAAVHARRPDIVSASDVRRGDFRAKLLAQQRRLVYLALRARMS